MAQDQFGNYIADIEPVPAPYPASSRCCLHGDGAPDNSFGSDGKTYVDDSTGDFYVKAGGVWTLIGGSGGVSSGNLEGDGSPEGVVTPTAIYQWYRNRLTNNFYWATGLTSADWQLTI